MKKADLPRDDAGHITTPLDVYALRLEDYPGAPCAEDDLYVRLEPIEGDMRAPRVSIVHRLNPALPPSHFATAAAAQRWAQYALPHLQLMLPMNLVVQGVVLVDDMETLQ